MTAEAINLLDSTFLGKYLPENDAVASTPEQGLMFGARGACSIIERLGGVSFNYGIYRVHSLEIISKWNEIVGRAFPESAGNICCFGVDWLGRQFAVDRNRLVDGDPGVVFFDPADGSAHEIDANLLSFHCVELIKHPDAALALEAFLIWKSENVGPLRPDECIGYKMPLLLGGLDQIDNMEVVDLEVYWHVSAQLLVQLRSLPEGSKIGSVRAE